MNVLADTDAAKTKEEKEVVNFIVVDSERTEEPEFHRHRGLVLFITRNLAKGFSGRPTSCQHRSEAVLFMTSYP